MKLVIQRVANATVKVEEKIIGEIGKGFLVFIGVKQGDTTEQADVLIKKLCNLRVFEDKNNKMNLSIKDIQGKILIVSQFTLYANCEKGNRPSFIEAAKPEDAQVLYEYFKQGCKDEGIEVESGRFGTDMKVSLLNDGPVTIIIDSKER